MEHKLKALIEATAKKFSLPSISVSVLTPGHEYHIALGKHDIEAGTVATPDSLYSIGSSTKAFIATALFILAREGRLDLDKPVSDALPWFKMYDDHATRNLTPRDALSHRSGLPRHDLTWLNTPGRTLREMVEAVAFLPPAWDIRYRFHYQNHMFMLATALVEHITQMPWGEFVDKRICKPLGMDATYANGSMIPDGDPRKARPYVLKDEKHSRMEYNYAVNVGGAGTIYSSTRDMLKWLRFRLEGNDVVLDKAALDEMHSPQMVIKAGEMSPNSFNEIYFQAYGLAWFTESYRGVRTVHHGGTIDGFKSEQLFVPEHGIAVSTLCNLNNTSAMSALPYKIIDLILGLEPIDWDARYFDASKRLMAQMREKTSRRIEEAKASAQEGAQPLWYAGLYRHPAYGDITFEARDGRLFAKVMGGESEMLYGGDDSFVLLNERYGMAFPAEFKRCGDDVCAVEIPFEEMVASIPARFEKVRE